MWGKYLLIGECRSRIRQYFQGNGNVPLDIRKRKAGDPRQWFSRYQKLTHVTT